MDHPQVLIADDDEGSAALLRRQVRDVLSLDSEVVKSRREMLSKVNGHELLFVDLKLEGTVDETISQLRELRDNYPVVVVTAQKDPDVLRAVADLELCLLEKGEFGKNMLFYETLLARRLFDRRRQLNDQQEVLQTLKGSYERNMADKGQ